MLGTYVVRQEWCCDVRAIDGLIPEYLATICQVGLNYLSNDNDVYLPETKNNWAQENSTELQQVPTEPSL